MRQRSITAGVALALVLGVGGGSTFAASPEPTLGSPTASDVAEDAVRALDPRFATIEDYEMAARHASAAFDFAPVMAGSWIRVLPTFGQEFEALGGVDVPAWIAGDVRLVEVMLVDGCPDEIRYSLPTQDPCASRHHWFYRWTPESGPTLIAETDS